MINGSKEAFYWKSKDAIKAKIRESFNIKQEFITILDNEHENKKKSYEIQNILLYSICYLTFMYAVNVFGIEQCSSL